MSLSRPPAFPGAPRAGAHGPAYTLRSDLCSGQTAPTTPRQRRSSVGSQHSRRPLPRTLGCPRASEGQLDGQRCREPRASETGRRPEAGDASPPLSSIRRCPVGPLGLSVFYFFSLLIRFLVSVCHRSNTSLSWRLLRSLGRTSLRADITLTHGNSHPSPPGVCNATRGSCPAPESRKPGPAALASPGRGLNSCAGRSDLGQDPGGLGDGVPLGRGLRPTCEDSAPGTTRLWKSEFEGETSLSQKSVNIVKGQINSLIVSLAQSRVFPIHLSPGAAVRVLDASELDTGCASPTHGVGGSPRQARPRRAACRTD